MMTCSVHSDFGNYAKPVLPKPVPAVDRTCISPVFAGGAVAQDSSRGLGATTRLVRSEFHNVTLFGRYPFFKNVVICFDDLGLSSTLRGTVYGSVSRGDLFSPPNQVISNRGNQLGEDPCTVDGRPPIARLYLLGPVRLTDQDGFDRTPKGGVRRALLAVLALSQHGTKSRLSLQDMFWGDRDPVRGASSLRNALSVLKKDLAELGDELITSDAQDVRLNMDRLWVDVAHYASENGGALLRQTHGQRLPDLIEGLNVRATGDDTFEDWLRVERQHWIDVLEPRLAPPVERERIDPPLRDPARTALPDLQSHFGIGLLPTISRANALHAGLFGDSIMDSIADNLRSLHLAEIYDYRADQFRAVRYRAGERTIDPVAAKAVPGCQSHQHDTAGLSYKPAALAVDLAHGGPLCRRDEFRQSGGIELHQPGHRPGFENTARSVVPSRRRLCEYALSCVEHHVPAGRRGVG